MQECLVHYYGGVMSLFWHCYCISACRLSVMQQYKSLPCTDVHLYYAYCSTVSLHHMTEFCSCALLIVYISKKIFFVTPTFCANAALSTCNICVETLAETSNNTYCSLLHRVITENTERTTAMYDNTYTPLVGLHTSHSPRHFCPWGFEVGVLGEGEDWRS